MQFYHWFLENKIVQIPLLKSSDLRFPALVMTLPSIAIIKTDSLEGVYDVIAPMKPHVWPLSDITEIEPFDCCSVSVKDGFCDSK